MSDSFEGLDPYECRVLAASVDTSWGMITTLSEAIGTVAARGQFTALAAPVRKPLTETVEELKLTTKLLRTKATAMDAVERTGMRMAGLEAAADKALGALDASLDDANNATLNGDTVLDAVEELFDDIDTDRDGAITQKELDAAAKSSVPAVKAAATFLNNNPTLKAYVASASDDSYTLNVALKPARDDDRGDRPVALTRNDLTAARQQNEAMRQILDNWKELNSDRDDRVSLKDLDATIADKTAKASLVAACQYIKDHPKFFERLDCGADLFRQGEMGTDGLMSRKDLISVAVNQQSFTSDPEFARKIVVQKFPNITFGQETLDNRDISDEGFTALAKASLAGSKTLLEATEVVAFLPESPSGGRNKLITYYYTLVGAEKTKWTNSSLPNPLDVTDRNHAGWDWLVIGANASNSVGGTIRGDLAIVNGSERNQMAQGNQRIFTDVAVRNAALMEEFPPGKPVTDEDMKRFFDKRKYANGTFMFDEGDRQMRDAMFYSLSARDAKDPEQRKLLNFKASVSTAIHEQAAIQEQLEGLFSQTVGDDGLVRWAGARIGGGALGIDDAQVANKLLGRLQFGTTGPKYDLSKDLDAQGITLPKNNPLNAYELGTDLSPAGDKTVMINGKQVSLDGTSLNLKNAKIHGWETDFAIDPKVWQDKGTEDREQLVRIPVVVGPIVVPVSVKTGTNDPKTKLEGTGGTDWSEYEQRMWYIANLFQQYTFDPRVAGWNNEFTPQAQPYLPKKVKAPNP